VPDPSTSRSRTEVSDLLLSEPSNSIDHALLSFRYGWMSDYSSGTVTCQNGHFPTSAEPPVRLRVTTLFVDAPCNVLQHKVLTTSAPIIIAQRLRP
jgi:hypothetical protein